MVESLVSWPRQGRWEAGVEASQRAARLGRAAA